MACSCLKGHCPFFLLSSPGVGGRRGGGDGPLPQLLAPHQQFAALVTGLCCSEGSEHSPGGAKDRNGRHHPHPRPVVAKTFPDVGKALRTCSEACSTRLEGLTVPHCHLPSAVPCPLIAPYGKLGICNYPKKQVKGCSKGPRSSPL